VKRGGGIDGAGAFPFLSVVSFIFIWEVILGIYSSAVSSEMADAATQP
jgi:hypothetical protein